MIMKNWFFIWKLESPEVRKSVPLTVKAQHVNSMSKAIIWEVNQLFSILVVPELYYDYIGINSNDQRRSAF